MKKIIRTVAATALLCIVSSMANAEETPALKVKITGSSPNSYYLCISNGGCVNIFAGTQGITFPLNPGKVNYMVLANSKNYQMFPQALPESCKVSLKPGQTLVVKGNIAQAGKQKTTIQKMSCSIVS